MNERISIAAKAPEAKSWDPVPQIRRKPSQSMNSPVDRILFLQRTIGNQAVTRLIESGALQTKLRIGQPGDKYEQEADRVAEQVVAISAHPATSSAPPRIQRLAVPSAGQVDAMSASVDHALSSPGMPLEPALRQDMEQRFGYGFITVRVHAGGRAGESAALLDANAYTVGQNIVFGANRYAPGTHEGQRLLSHELTHVVQQSRTTGVGASKSATESEADRAGDSVTAGYTPSSSPIEIRIMRQPSTAMPPMPVIRTFQQVWDEFDEHRRLGRNAEALSLVNEILSKMLGEDSMEHAGDLALWLLDQGQSGQAIRALNSLESAWWVRWVSTSGPGINAVRWPPATGPIELIQRGETEAAAGRHDPARELFATAFVFLQMQYQTTSDEHIRSLQQTMARLPPDVDFPIFRLMAYHDVGDLMARMRRILAFYPGLERSAIAAGNQAEAATYAEMGRQLRDRIREQFLLTGQSGLTLEASQVTSPRMGTGYRLHGVNLEEVDVFPLPGTPRPDELGRHPAYTAPMEQVFETLGGQEEFLTDLLRNPEIRAEFGTRRIDMTSLATRLRVWRVMYRVFQRAPAAGCPDALCSLLRLMQRYLRDFTTHTEYNIPDFGTYYINIEERGGFPTDLLGRTMRDCGVYALTVSYELFRTARGATPRINVEFQLYHTLEHVMLAILDHDNNKHYVVNNDQISGPNDGVDPLGLVALSYSQTMGRTLMVTPAARTDLGTTTQTEAKFRARAWQRYQAGAGLGLQTEPLTGPNDTRTEAERREATYTGFYRGQERFEQVGVQLHTQLDTLLRDTVAAAANQRAVVVSAPLADLTTAGMTMGRIFAMSLDPRRLGVSSAAASSITTPVGLFTSGRANVAHPLVRLAKVLLFHQGLGGTLTADQQTLVNLVRSGLVPGWAADLNNYIAAGRPATW